MSERILHLAAAPFEAARRISAMPPGHRARRLHGHGFVARVRAELRPGWAPFPGGETDALRARLAACVAPLDYGDLNEHLPVPTDENLARWLRERLAVPGLESVGVRSTGDQGADLAPDGRVHVWRRFRFEAAHRLPRVPEGHKCGRMHGHGFEVTLRAARDPLGAGAGVDHDRLGRVWAPLRERLHLACLNDLQGLENPTSELLASWIWGRVKPGLPGLARVSVRETATAGCHYDGSRHRIWKEQRLESALRLKRAPEGDPRRRLHGHSYLLRLGLSAPLDEVLGWTLDFGDVKALFGPVYERLDHRLLDDLPGIRSPDPATLALWVREEAAGLLPQLDRVDLTQTPGCGAALSWGAGDPGPPS